MRTWVSGTETHKAPRAHRLRASTHCTHTCTKTGLDTYAYARPASCFTQSQHSDETVAPSRPASLTSTLTGAARRLPPSARGPASPPSALRPPPSALRPPHFALRPPPLPRPPRAAPRLVGPTPRPASPLRRPAPPPPRSPLPTRSFAGAASRFGSGPPFRPPSGGEPDMTLPRCARRRRPTSPSRRAPRYLRLWL